MKNLKIQLRKYVKKTTSLSVLTTLLAVPSLSYSKTYSASDKAKALAQNTTIVDGHIDVSTFPNLVQGLMDRGYSDADIKKILSGNVLRVCQAIESTASALQKQ